MITIIIETVVFVITLLGALALAYVAALILVTPKSHGRQFVLLQCTDDEHDCARLLYSMHMRASLLCGLSKSEIIGVDCGMSDDERKVCQAMCREYSNMKILTPQQLAELISEETPD